MQQQKSDQLSWGLLSAFRWYRNIITWEEHVGSEEVNEENNKEIKTQR